MKKIFTLLVAVGLFTVAANAQISPRDNQQYGQRDYRQYDHQSGHWDRSYGNYDNDVRFKSNGNYGNGIEWQLVRINRKYDMKIQRIKDDFFMRRFEKMRMIGFLENQRQQEIRMLYGRSGYDGNLPYDRGHNSNRNY